MLGCNLTPKFLVTDEGAIRGAAIVTRYLAEKYTGIPYQNVQLSAKEKALLFGVYRRGICSLRDENFTKEDCEDAEHSDPENPIFQQAVNNFQNFLKPPSTGELGEEGAEVLPIMENIMLLFQK